ncbi:MAG: sigma-70 family RNA polymerase sigma factor [Planctomycetota bacterium]|nr:sigma-70 family RNA polymerase sigma factor [Planctomycetota bacterium]
MPLCRIFFNLGQQLASPSVLALDSGGDRPLSTQLREDDLVRRYLEGDSASAEALVEAYWDRVYAYAYRLTLNAADAEDITQETFLRAFRGIDSYSPEGQFKAWLLRIATNLVLDLRKSPKAREVAVDMNQQNAVLVEESPEAQMMSRELVSALWVAIHELAREQQVALVLRTIERFDYPQIAEILNVKESTARWHLYEARRMLRKKLAKRFDLEGQQDE